MGKVVTSQGLNEFIQTGKAEVVKPDGKAAVNGGAAPALETKPEAVAADVGAEPSKDEPPKDKETAAPEATDTNGLAIPAELLDEWTRKNAAINRKHREAREAEAAAEESERFAENQYNRARLAEERAERLERELNESKGKAAPAVEKAAEPVKPDPQKFYDDKGQFRAFEYAEELAAYAANKAVADDRAAQAKERQAAEAAQAEIQARARVAETMKKHPDFKEVMESTPVQTHTRVLEYLSASDHIGDVSYYMATHPEFVERINKLHPLKAIAEIGKLEATFDEPPKKESQESLAAAAKATSSAPAPIKPLNSATTVNTNTDPSKMSFKELRAFERARARKAR
jgi:hypothetical protein